MPERLIGRLPDIRLISVLQIANCHEGDVIRLEVGDIIGVEQVLDNLDLHMDFVGIK